MKKLFAYAAMALAALILSNNSDAKPGFAHVGWHHHVHPHHFAHLHDFDHRRHDFDRHHRFARDFDFFPGYFDYGPGYSEPVIVEVPQYGDDVTGSTDLRRVSVYRGYGPRGCSTENVTVPSEQGGETTVHVIRC